MAPLEFALLFTPMSSLQWDGTAVRRRKRPNFRHWIIPTIGAMTPVALIVVNIAAFIVNHLDTFRWLIAILAFVSGMMMNSWAGLSVYRWFKRGHGGHPLVHDSNQDVMLIAGMTVIILVSFLTAYFCYTGLSDQRNLPNAQTFLTGTLAILVPIILQRFFDRAANEGPRER